MTLSGRGGFLFLAIVAMACGGRKDASSPSEWPTFGHDASNNKFSQLTSIDTSNVIQLSEAWRIEDTADVAGLYVNPVMINNRLIGLMPSSHLVAMDPATGKVLWSFKPDTSSIPNWSKGITGHAGTNGAPDRIFLISGGLLYSINAATGKVMEN
ncbi:MAG: hypothetical protein EOO00_11640, partial [Chitinophagaceae bacterium]